MHSERKWQTLKRNRDDVFKTATEEVQQFFGEGIATRIIQFWNLFLFQKQILRQNTGKPNGWNRKASLLSFSFSKTRSKIAFCQHLQKAEKNNLGNQWKDHTTCSLFCFVGLFFIYPKYICLSMISIFICNKYIYMYLEDTSVEKNV